MNPKLTRASFPLLALSLFFWAAHLAAQPVRNGAVQVELVSAETSVQPGKSVWVALKMDHDAHWHSYWKVAGTRMEKFGIAGSGKIELTNLDQHDIKVSIAGSGTIKATGKVEEVRISIAGSGDADLGGVVSEDVTVKIAGSGNADIAPRDEAEIHIAGSGDVNLHTNPRKVETHIAGSGRIHNVGSGAGNGI